MALPTLRPVQQQQQHRLNQQRNASVTSSHDLKDANFMLINGHSTERHHQISGGNGRFRVLNDGSNGFNRSNRQSSVAVNRNPSMGINGNFHPSRQAHARHELMPSTYRSENMSRMQYRLPTNNNSNFPPFDNGSRRRSGGGSSLANITDTTTVLNVIPRGRQYYRPEQQAIRRPQQHAFDTVDKKPNSFIPGPLNSSRMPSVQQPRDRGGSVFGGSRKLEGCNTLKDGRDIDAIAITPPGGLPLIPSPIKAFDRHGRDLTTTMQTIKGEVNSGNVPTSWNHHQYHQNQPKQQHLLHDPVKQQLHFRQLKPANQQLQNKTRQYGYQQQQQQQQQLGASHRNNYHNRQQPFSAYGGNNMNNSSKTRALFDGSQYHHQQSTAPGGDFPFYNNNSSHHMSPRLLRIDKRGEINNNNNKSKMLMFGNSQRNSHGNSPSSFSAAFQQRDESGASGVGGGGGNRSRMSSLDNRERSSRSSRNVTEEPKAAADAALIKESSSSPLAQRQELSPRTNVGTPAAATSSPAAVTPAAEAGKVDTDIVKAAAAAADNVPLLFHDSGLNKYSYHHKKTRLLGGRQALTVVEVKSEESTATASSKKVDNADEAKTAKKSTDAGDASSAMHATPSSSDRVCPCVPSRSAISSGENKNISSSTLQCCFDAASAESMSKFINFKAVQEATQHNRCSLLQKEYFSALYTSAASSTTAPPPPSSEAAAASSSSASSPQSLQRSPPTVTATMDSLTVAQTSVANTDVKRFFAVQHSDFIKQFLTRQLSQLDLLTHLIAKHSSSNSRSSRRHLSSTSTATGDTAAGEQQNDDDDLQQQQDGENQQHQLSRKKSSKSLKSSKKLHAKSHADDAAAAARFEHDLSLLRFVSSSSSDSNDDDDRGRRHTHRMLKQLYQTMLSNLEASAVCQRALAGYQQHKIDKLLAAGEPLPPKRLILAYTLAALRRIITNHNRKQSVEKRVENLMRHINTNVNNDSMTELPAVYDNVEEALALSTTTFDAVVLVAGSKSGSTMILNHFPAAVRQQHLLVRERIKKQISIGLMMDKVCAQIQRSKREKLLNERSSLCGNATFLKGLDIVTQTFDKVNQRMSWNEELDLLLGYDELEQKMQHDCTAPLNSYERRSKLAALADDKFRNSDTVELVLNMSNVIQPQQNPYKPLPPPKVVATTKSFKDEFAAYRVENPRQDFDQYVTKQTSKWSKSQVEQFADSYRQHPKYWMEIGTDMALPAPNDAVTLYRMLKITTYEYAVQTGNALLLLGDADGDDDDNDFEPKPAMQPSRPPAALNFFSVNNHNHKPSAAPPTLKRIILPHHQQHDQQHQSSSSSRTLGGGFFVLNPPHSKGVAANSDDTKRRKLSICAAANRPPIGGGSIAVGSVLKRWSFNIKDLFSRIGFQWYNLTVNTSRDVNEQYDTKWKALVKKEKSDAVVLKRERVRALKVAASNRQRSSLTTTARKSSNTVAGAVGRRLTTKSTLSSSASASNFLTGSNNNVSDRNMSLPDSAASPEEEENSTNVSFENVTVNTTTTTTVTTTITATDDGFEMANIDDKKSSAIDNDTFEQQTASILLSVSRNSEAEAIAALTSLSSQVIELSPMKQQQQQQQLEEAEPMPTLLRNDVDDGFDDRMDEDGSRSPRTPPMTPPPSSMMLLKMQKHQKHSSLFPPKLDGEVGAADNAKSTTSYNKLDDGGIDSFNVEEVIDSIKKQQQQLAVAATTAPGSKPLPKKRGRRKKIRDPTTGAASAATAAVVDNANAAVVAVPATAAAAVTAQRASTTASSMMIAAGAGCGIAKSAHKSVRAAKRSAMAAFNDGIVKQPAPPKGGNAAAQPPPSVESQIAQQAMAGLMDLHAAAAAMSPSEAISADENDDSNQYNNSRNRINTGAGGSSILATAILPPLLVDASGDIVVNHHHKKGGKFAHQRGHKNKVIGKPKNTNIMQQQQQNLPIVSQQISVAPGVYKRLPIKPTAAPATMPSAAAAAAANAAAYAAYSAAVGSAAAAAGNDSRRPFFFANAAAVQSSKHNNNSEQVNTTEDLLTQPLRRKPLPIIKPPILQQQQAVVVSNIAADDAAASENIPRQRKKVKIQAAAAVPSAERRNSLFSDSSLNIVPNASFAAASGVVASGSLPASQDTSNKAASDSPITFFRTTTSAAAAPAAAVPVRPLAQLPVKKSEETTMKTVIQSAAARIVAGGSLATRFVHNSLPLKPDSQLATATNFRFSAMPQSYAAAAAPAPTPATFSQSKYSTPENTAVLPSAVITAAAAAAAGDRSSSSSGSSTSSSNAAATTASASTALFAAGTIRRFATQLQQQQQQQSLPSTPFRSSVLADAARKRFDSAAAAGASAMSQQQQKLANSSVVAGATQPATTAFRKFFQPAEINNINSSGGSKTTDANILTDDVLLNAAFAKRSKTRRINNAGTMNGGGEGGSGDFYENISDTST